METFASFIIGLLCGMAIVAIWKILDKWDMQMKNWKTWIGLIIVCILVAELCAWLENTDYINFNFIVETLTSKLTHLLAPQLSWQSACLLNKMSQDRDLLGPPMDEVWKQLRLKTQPVRV